MFFRIAVALWLLSVVPALADSRPSDASLRELLELTETKKLVDSIGGQVDHMMEQSIKEALKGKSVGAEEEKAIRKMRAGMIAVFRKEMSWESMEPFYISIYRDHFTQAEIDGLLAFYRSEAGKAMTRKMPLIMQASMSEVQKRMPAMMSGMKQVQDQFVADLSKSK